MLRSPPPASATGTPCPSPPSSPPLQDDFDGASIARVAFAAGMQLASRGAPGPPGDLSASVAEGIDFHSVLGNASELLEADPLEDAGAALRKAFDEVVARQTHSHQIQSRQDSSRKRARPSLSAVEHPRLVSVSFSHPDEASGSQKNLASFMDRFFVRGYDISLLPQRGQLVLGRIDRLFHQTVEELSSEQSSGGQETSSLVSRSVRATSVDIYVVMIFRYLVITGRRYTPEQVKDTLTCTGCFDGYSSSRGASDHSMKRVLTLLGQDVSDSDVGIETLPSTTCRGDGLTVRVGSSVVCHGELVCGASPNVMSSWKEYDRKERTILGESVEVSLSSEMVAILLCEKRGHVNEMLRSNDQRLGSYICISDGGCITDGCMEFACAVSEAHEFTFGVPLEVLVFSDLNTQGLSIGKKMHGAGCSVKFLVNPKSIQRFGLLDNPYHYGSILAECSEFDSDLVGATNHVNIEDLLSFKTPDVAVLAMDLAEEYLKESGRLLGSDCQ